jgi:hypothetical protein
MSKIESILLMEKKPVLIFGDAEVGKSAVVAELGEWWEQTGLFREVFIFRVSPLAPWDLGDAINILSKSVWSGLAPVGLSGFLEHLQDESGLLILDGLDVVTVPRGKITRRQRRDIVELVQQATKCSLPLILTSRAPEAWLWWLVSPYRLRGLGLRSGCELFHRMTAIGRVNQPEPEAFRYDSTEDQDYTEQLVKLVDGNPLAISLLAALLTNNAQSLKSFYTDMVLGKPLNLGITDVGQEGFRAMPSSRRSLR